MHPDLGHVEQKPDEGLGSRTDGDAYRTGEPDLHLVYELTVLGVALAVSVAGWRVFWFLTDDAFITFRYASNWLLGWGPNWNPPPFQPVEGYTSFLWLAILTGTWLLTGVEPPAVANWLSLFCGLALLIVLFRLVRRMTLSGVGPRGRVSLLALVLLGTVTNRTFLTWLSSGLETALFDLCLVSWVYLAVTRPSERGSWWSLCLSTVAALAALSRPDGLLAVAGTIALVLRPPRDVSRRRLLGATPLLAIPAHLLIRRAYYGEWLPNTYYAKSTGPWFESGWRYAASFVVEYGFWVIPLIAVVALVVQTRSHGATAFDPRPLLGEAYGASVAVAVVAGHALFYTFAIGGDHFEYRPFSHLVPLIFAVAAWLAARTGPSWRPLLVLSLMVIASWPIPWIHWEETHNLTLRRETHVLIAPIHEHFPAPLSGVVSRWDEWQAWLIERHVCMRHQEHKIFYEHQVRVLPPRGSHPEFAWVNGRPVMAAMTVGVLGWVFPEVAIIDVFGLNDPVVARNPRLREPLQMAHARQPPPGYVGCFLPDIQYVPPSGAVRVPRNQVLTDETIAACQARDWYPAP